MGGRVVEAEVPQESASEIGLGIEIHWMLGIETEMCTADNIVRPAWKIRKSGCKLYGYEQEPVIIVCEAFGRHLSTSMI